MVLHVGAIPTELGLLTMMSNQMNLENNALSGNLNIRSSARALHHLERCRDDPHGTRTTRAAVGRSDPCIIARCVSPMFVGLMWT
jgi:hypothetical protein